MTKRQFNIRHLFFALTLFSIALEGIIWLTEHPLRSFFFACVRRLPFDLIGGAVVVLAGLIAILLYSELDTTEQ